MIYLIIICSLFYYVIGVCGFIYWWTKDYDLTDTEVPIGLMAGLSGPFAWIIGYCFHGTSNKILIKKNEPHKNT